MALKMEGDVIVEVAKARCSVKNRQKPHCTQTIVMESGVSLFEVPAAQGRAHVIPNLVESTRRSQRESRAAECLV
jgi:hypothetical protein